MKKDPSKSRQTRTQLDCPLSATSGQSLCRLNSFKGRFCVGLNTRENVGDRLHLADQASGSTSVMGPSLPIAVH